jgi:DNA-binding winged helix-turn-helix (wHTH) protein
MKRNVSAKASPRRADPLVQARIAARGASSDAALEFGRFRVLLRQRQLLADGVPVELGSRAFDVLLVLLEADGLLVTKEELISRVWPGIVVVEENLKFHVCALRKALGPDRDVIHTETGRGYRFTGVLRSQTTAGPCYPMRPRPLPRRVFFPISCRHALPCRVNSSSCTAR